ncbi:MAG: hypothetical protein J6K99_02010, partial [Peptococcaceae bacterium]|nr:hypothetical protein [Peptococcaceae bacterium]
MKKAKKVVALALCAVLLVVGSVTGTMAYLTSQDEVVNTFTVGNVVIKLDEKNVDGDKITVDGKEETPERDKSNDYKLIPGGTYVKDPTVHVEANSEPSYVRMLVTVNNVNALKEAFPDKVVDGVFLLQDFVDWNSSVWAFEGYKPADNGGIYEFRYSIADGVVTVDKNVVDADGYYTLPALFNNITIPGTVDNTDLAKLQGVTIDVKAHAIQAAGFEETKDAQGTVTATAEENAWAAFDG